ncbi:hypothetical protein MFU01_69300 [Myxococcus fulvus]|uniref:Uncharacterized protein n=1 Tax=Myxococcus fulvus TaxID=33 RepID=A0A511TE01_MYXFU|nr:hypothetical protein MFU01_69300 [Myxococcus fulvus]
MVGCHNGPGTVCAREQSEGVKLATRSAGAGSGATQRSACNEKTSEENSARTEDTRAWAGSMGFTLPSRADAFQVAGVGAWGVEW